MERRRSSILLKKLDFAYNSANGFCFHFLFFPLPWLAAPSLNCGCVCHCLNKTGSPILSCAGAGRPAGRYCIQRSVGGGWDSPWKPQPALWGAQVWQQNRWCKSMARLGLPDLGMGVRIWPYPCSTPLPGPLFPPSLCPFPPSCLPPSFPKPPCRLNLASIRMAYLGSSTVSLGWCDSPLCPSASCAARSVPCSMFATVPGQRKRHASAQERNRIVP